MRYWALDVLACMYCKNYPLKLYVFKKVEEDVKIEDITKPYCKSYCGYLKESIRQGKEYPCEECLRIEIVEGLLYCQKCKHWYPIKNGIVIMMPDNKRNKKSDIEFLKKHESGIPEEILKEGKPFNLSTSE